MEKIKKIVKEVKKLKKRYVNNLILLIIALIWGAAFVAQSAGMDYIGPFTFNSARSILGGIVLIPVIYVLYKKRKEEISQGKEVIQNKKTLIIGGICCGFFLMLGSSLQQIGIQYTTAGKAGFITALYILIVPILGLAVGKKAGIKVWIGVVLAVIGLYFLSMTSGLSIAKGDFYILLGSVAFSFHILVIDHFSPLVDGVRMSCIQFLVAGVLSAFPMFFSEMGHSAAGIVAWLSQLQSWDAWVAILYAGVMSSGVAYTLQIIAQNGLNPTLASMIVSLESVFSVLAGWVILGEVLTARQLLGCLLIFIAIIFAQIPVGAKKEA